MLPDNLTVLTPSTAEDKDVIVCNQETIDEYGFTDSQWPRRGVG